MIKNMDSSSEARENKNGASMSIEKNQKITKGQNRELSSISQLIGLALALLGKKHVLKLDPAELSIAKGCSAPATLDVDWFAAKIEAGEDILGNEYCRLKSAEDRRQHGATFTPTFIVESMFNWAEANISPALIVDPGAGSGRYAVAAAQRFPKAKVVAVEIDPALRIISKARMVAMGLDKRISIEPASFLEFKRPTTKGRILYIGNPPYVRHHDIEPSEKEKYAERCKKLGVASSGLSGLHIHFMVKIFDIAKPGDAMAFITAAEWMDTNYGKGLRHLLASGLHEVSVGSFAREDIVFQDALASAAITCVNFGKPVSSIKFDTLSTAKKISLGKGKKAAVAIAKDAPSWTGQLQFDKNKATNQTTLGDLFRVSRGMVTGMNDVWLVSRDTPKLPEHFLHPCITNAEDITSLTNWRLTSKDNLRKLVNLPEILDDFPEDDLAAIQHFLKWAKEKGADSTFTAKHRKCWWRLDIKSPPPIVMTYMGRRPPVFARNLVGAPLLNIAHGLYPKIELSDEEQDALVSWLNKNVAIDSGRSYAGGLVKFEPGEAMRIAIPDIKTIMGTVRGH